MLPRIAMTAAAGLVAAGIGWGQWNPTEEAVLTSGDATEDSDHFGDCVAVVDDTAVIGAPQDDLGGKTDAGSTHVFVRSGTSWTKQAVLTASDAKLQDEFGCSVSLSGDIAVVGARWDDHAGGTNAGSAYVFVRSGTSWTEQAKLTASDAAAGDEFGIFVSLSGDTALVGVPFDDHAGGTDAGSAYVFVRNGASWTEQAKLTASDAALSDIFGWSVSLSGDTAVLGARWDDHGGGTNAGSAYVFVRSGTSWTEQAKLTASDATAGDFFGASVSLSGDTMVVGAVLDDYPGKLDAGSAYVFVRSGTSWTEQAKVGASDAAAGDNFGNAVSISDGTVLVAAVDDELEGEVDAGSVYLFVRSGTSWTEQAKLIASDPQEGDSFGCSVSLSDDTAVVGAFTDNSPFIDAGAAYVFRLLSWASYCTAGTSASGCQALISASGTASATAPSGFVVSASKVEGQKDGLFFWGKSGKQANPWGNGTSFQCVIPPVTRGGSLAGSGTIGACDGSFAQDLNATWCGTCPYPQKNPGAGAVVQAQLWYRDPLSTSNQTTSLSDAIELVVQP